MAEAKKKSVFEVMSAIDISLYVFTKSNQSYLPWSRAVELLKLKYPDAKVTECSFVVDKFVSAVISESKDIKQYENVLTKVNMPYFTDGRTCYVQTRLEIPSEGVDEYCTLPVMDYKNQCISADKITMDAVNKSLRRCATKNIAMATGLGLGLWHKEETSETAEAQKILDNLDRQDAIGKFKSKVAEGYDRMALSRWSKALFGTSNPATIKNEEVLERLNSALDSLTQEELSSYIETKTEKEGKK